MKYVSTALNWVLLLLIMNLVVMEFVTSHLFTISLEIGIVLLLIAAMLSVTSYSKWVAVVLTVIGAAMYWLSHASADEALSGFAFNFGIVGLIFVVPVIGIAIHTGGYLDALRQKMLLQRERGKSQSSYSYSIANLLTMLLGPFLNVGTVQIVNELAHKSLDRFCEKKMGMVLFRGCASAFYWSPFGGMLILTMDVLDVRWSSILGFLLIGACCHVVLSALLFQSTVFERDVWVEQPSDSSDLDEKQIHRKIGSFIGIMLGLIVLAVFLEMVTSLSMVMIIIMLSIGYSFLWMIVIGEIKPFLLHLRSYVNRAFLSVRVEILLFVSAGFFASAVSQSSFHHGMLAFFETLISLPVPLFILALFLMFILAGLVGIHGVILLTLVGTSLTPSAYGWNPYFLPIALMFAVILYQQTSPFSALMILVSKLTRSNTIELIRANMRFTVSLFGALGVVLWCISFL